MACGRADSRSGIVRLVTKQVGDESEKKKKKEKEEEEGGGGGGGG